MPDYQDYEEINEAYDRAVRNIFESTRFRVDVMGGACPFQATGKTGDEREFYFRFRHDVAALYICEEGSNYFRDTTEYAETTLDSGYDRGTLSFDEAAELIDRLWKARQPIEKVESTTVSRLADEVKYMTEHYRVAQVPEEKRE